MSRLTPSDASSAGWKGIAIVGGAVVLGIGIIATFSDNGTSSVVRVGSEAAASGTPTTKKGSVTTLPVTTTTTLPLHQPKDVKVLVANATDVKAASAPVISAIKPGCYDVVSTGYNTTTKVSAAKPPTTNVYYIAGYTGEAQLLASQLNLQKDSVQSLPDPSPVPTKGTPSFDLLVVVGKDFADSPPQAILNGIPCTAATSSTSTTVKASSSHTSTTKKTSSTSTTVKSTTTTVKTTTTTKPTTTTT